MAALFKGDDYEKSVVNSLQDITSKSENLRHEATKADMSQSARNWKLAEHRKDPCLLRLGKSSDLGSNFNYRP